MPRSGLFTVAQLSHLLREMHTVSAVSGARMPQLARDVNARPRGWTLSFASGRDPVGPSSQRQTLTLR